VGEPYLRPALAETQARMGRMSRRPKHDDPVVIPFRPRPKPPKVPAPWQHSVKFFAILLAVIAVLRALYTGLGLFNLYDALFVVLLAGAVAFGDFLARRR
jgi:hypothetical protein